MTTPQPFPKVTLWDLLVVTRHEEAIYGSGRAGRLSRMNMNSLLVQSCGKLIPYLSVPQQSDFTLLTELIAGWCSGEEKYCIPSVAVWGKSKKLVMTQSHTCSDTWGGTSYNRLLGRAERMGECHSSPSTTTRRPNLQPSIHTEITTSSIRQHGAFHSVEDGPLGGRPLID